MDQQINFPIIIISFLVHGQIFLDFESTRYFISFTSSFFICFTSLFFHFSVNLYTSFLVNHGPFTCVIITLALVPLCLYQSKHSNELRKLQSVECLDLIQTRNGSLVLTPSQANLLELNCQYTSHITNSDGKASTHKSPNENEWKNPSLSWEVTCLRKQSSALTGRGGNGIF